MNDAIEPSKEELLQNLAQGWNTFNAYLGTLSVTQLTTPTDAAGWTVKDHIMHLAVWEAGVAALLQRRDRREAMGLDEATWNSRDFDTQNAVIQRQHKDKTLAEVMEAFTEAHRELVRTIEGLTDDDLRRPYREYQPTSTYEEPVVGWIAGNSYEHYDEHRPWIEAIVNGG